MCAYPDSVFSLSFPSYPLPLASSCVMRGLLRSWGLGVAPHILYQAAHEGRARLLRGCSPLSFGMEDPPPPSLSPFPACCALVAHAAQGVSLPQWPIYPPPSLSCMPCASSARCSGGAPSSSSWLRESPSPHLGMPCAGSACCRWGGSPSLSGIGPHDVGAFGLSPFLSCPRVVCAR